MLISIVWQGFHQEFASQRGLFPTSREAGERRWGSTVEHVETGGEEVRSGEDVVGSQEFLRNGVTRDWRRHPVRALGRWKCSINKITTQSIVTKYNSHQPKACNEWR